ncbi:MAG TPA: ketopantoate reductase C-terminal domain-containing protein, partial [Candidatus Omnitrophota bacterium]|nr:ketopantoate reductase C-terminal domain-containing protein [Candidatus Omnitrophota bacterium]
KEKRTGIDAINGMVVRLGKKHKVPTPVNAFLSPSIRKAERCSWTTTGTSRGKTA